MQAMRIAGQQLNWTLRREKLSPEPGQMLGSYPNHKSAAGSRSFPNFDFF
jgi:hypothetical protein